MFFTCSKIVPQHTLSVEQAMMYMKLRQNGCSSKVARRYCSKNVCLVGTLISNIDRLDHEEIGSAQT